MSKSFLHDILLTDEEVARCEGALLKLARPITPMVLTGGLAVGWHGLQNRLLQEKSNLNDIDLVVDGLSDLNNSLSQDFLISHFHPSRPRGKILVQVIDEESRLRIDVFTACSTSLRQRLQKVSEIHHPLQIIGAEDLLAKLCAILTSVLNNEPAEPKYFKSFNRLFAIADLAIAKSIWNDYRKASHPSDFETAAEAVRQSINVNPEILQKGDYSQNIIRPCSWCEESQLFPVVPPARVFEIWDMCNLLPVAID